MDIRAPPRNSLCGQTDQISPATALIAYPPDRCPYHPSGNNTVHKTIRVLSSIHCVCKGTPRAIYGTRARSTLIGQEAQAPLPLPHTNHRRLRTHQPAVQRQHRPIVALHRDPQIYLDVDNGTPQAPHGHNGPTKDLPRFLRARPLHPSSTTHRQRAHHRERHLVGSSAYKSPASQQAPPDTRRHPLDRQPHRLLHQRTKPRWRPDSALCTHHGQQEAPKLFPAAGEAG